MRRSNLFAVSILLILLFGLYFFLRCSSEVFAFSSKEVEATNNEWVDTKTKAKVLEAYSKLPLYFIQNNGQVNRKVKYYERGLGHAMYFTEDGVYLSLFKRKSSLKKEDEGVSRKKAEETIEARNLKLTFIGADSVPEVIAENRLEGRVNYFIGNDPAKWKTNIPIYGSILYKEVWKGIDIRFYGNQRQMEYDVIVKPGADLSKVRFALEGIEGLKVTERGELEVYVKGLKGEAVIIQHKPRVYQEVDGKIRELDGRFVIVKSDPLKKKAIYAFEVSKYDRKRPLIIDPVLVYSTYLGGSSYDYFSTDEGHVIAVDSSGNVYVTGWTESSDFPTTEDAYQGLKLGGGDAFVTKLSSTGSLIYSTYLGGSGWDKGFAIAIDSSGNVYVTGGTDSDDFPTKNAYQGTRAGWWDAFVTKLSSTGSLIYSTYLGGSGYNDYGYSIAVDSSGNVYVTGWTGSGDFPTTPDAYDTSYNSDGDTFITKLSPSGDSLIYSTYLGGSEWDKGFDIAVDSSGNAYVIGETESTDFPTTPDAYDTSYNGNGDTFITKLGSTGDSLIYSTYLGGSGDDEGRSIAVDSSGNVYVTGWTDSDDFPTTPDAYDTSYNGNGDVFITKLGSTGDSLICSTYLGGSGDDGGRSIAVDSSGNVYVTGATWSTDFPTTPDAYDTSYNGNGDVFITKLGSTGDSLIYSTYLGGSDLDGGIGIAVDSSGNLYVTGLTESTDFPTTQNAYDTSYNGEVDVFVIKLAEEGYASPFPDVSCDHWAVDYISAIKDAGITVGYPDGTFRPEESVTRAQMAAFIIRAIEGEPQQGSYNTDPYFADVDPTHWAFKYVQRVRERNIAHGYPGNLYGPEDDVTREQMAKMLIMGLVSEGKIAEPPEDYCLSGSSFPDVEQDRWSCRYIKRLKELGITTGYPDGTYRPEASVTRAEMAAFIYRAFLQ